MCETRSLMTATALEGKRCQASSKLWDCERAWLFQGDQSKPPRGHRPCELTYVHSAQSRCKEQNWNVGFGRSSSPDSRWVTEHVGARRDHEQVRASAQFCCARCTRRGSLDPRRRSSGSVRDRSRDSINALAFLVHLVRSIVTRPPSRHRQHLHQGRRQARAWLRSHPRVRCVFTPKHGSGLEQVAIWFGTLARVASRRVASRRAAQRIVRQPRARSVRGHPTRERGRRPSFKWTCTGKYRQRHCRRAERWSRARPPRRQAAVADTLRRRRCGDRPGRHREEWAARTGRNLDVPSAPRLSRVRSRGAGRRGR
jgi:hypothetical protein